MQRAFAPLVLLSLLGLPACGGDSSAGEVDASRDAVLRFTAIPDKNTQDLKARFDPVAEWLGRELGIEVEYVPSADYEASVRMFQNGDVHLAWFGGLTGVQAQAAVPGARAIVQGEEDLAFRSYFIANASTGIERSEEFPMELAGKTFTFGSRKSTSGRLMPEHFIRTNTGKSPEEFFAGSPGYQDGHDQTAAAVASGQYQAGAINYQIYEERVKEGKIDPGIVRVVWETPTYADYNMTAHPEIDVLFGEGTIDRLQAALVSMKGEKLLAAFGRSALVEASNADLAHCAEVARSLDLLR